MCAYNMKIFTICHPNIFISFSVLEWCGWLRKVSCCDCHVFLLSSYSSSSLSLFLVFSSSLPLPPALFPFLPSLLLLLIFLLSPPPFLTLSLTSIPILLLSPCPPCLPLFMPLSTFISIFKEKLLVKSLPALVKDRSLSCSFLQTSCSCLVSRRWTDQQRYGKMPINPGAMPAHRTQETKAPCQEVLSVH